MRAAGSDEALKLVPPSVFSLEKSLEFIKDDELVEVTPESIRLRKVILQKELRAKAQNRKKYRLIYDFSAYYYIVLREGGACERNR